MPYLELEEPEPPEPIEDAEDSALMDFTPGIVLRDYQERCIAAVEAGWKEFSRQLVDMPTGSGKSSVFAAIAKREVAKGGKVLILAHRDRLVRQAAGRIASETGLDVDIEMAGDYASASAPVVVASVQTLCNEARLLGFEDRHFSLVVGDEAHHSISPSWLKVIHYFNHGARSLDDGWVPPLPGVPYQRKANVLGVTATPDLMGRRTLGELYEALAFRYTITEAVRDGWLVPLIMKSMALKIDVRGVKVGKTSEGSDFTDRTLGKHIVPVIDALAEQLYVLAHDRKTMAFVPSVECAELLADAVNRLGMKGIWVSGDTEKDDDIRTRNFMASGAGTVLCNASIYAEGVDFPDVDCIMHGRVTKSRSRYCQQTGRGTRTLPGTVDGLPTPELRRAAIAASAKPNTLLLDPLWLSDRLDICQPYDLVTTHPKVRAIMAEMGGEGLDLVSMEAAATRDFIAALEKEAKRQKAKAARTIDPLGWAVDLGDEKMASYEPETELERRAPTEGMLNFLRRQRIDVEKVTSFGLAREMIARITNRFRMDLATPHQLHFLAQLGFDREKAVVLSQRDATATIDALLAEKKNRHAQRK
jgi:superfamily II DNA or RNA helicase